MEFTKYLAQHSPIIAVAVSIIFTLLLLLYKKEFGAIKREFESTDNKIDTINKHNEGTLSIILKNFESKLDSIKNGIEKEESSRLYCKKESGSINKSIFAQIIRLEDDIKALSNEVGDLKYIIGELKGSVNKN